MTSIKVLCSLLLLISSTVTMSKPIVKESPKNPAFITKENVDDYAIVIRNSTRPDALFWRSLFDVLTSRPGPKGVRTTPLFKKFESEGSRRGYRRENATWIDDGPTWTDDGPTWTDDGPTWIDDGPTWADDGPSWTKNPWTPDTGFKRKCILSDEELIQALVKRFPTSRKIAELFWALLNPDMFPVVMKPRKNNWSKKAVNLRNKTTQNKFITE